MRAFVLTALVACAKQTPVGDGSEVTVSATPRLVMRLPGPVEPLEHVPVGSGSVAAVGYEVRGEVVVLVQRGALDGGCAAYLGREQEAVEQQLATPAAKETLTLAMTRAPIAGTDALISSGRQRVGIVWIATAVIATCRDSETLVLTATSKTTDAPAEVARLRTMALRAAETLAPAPGARDPLERVAATATLTMKLPAPATLVAGPEIDGDKTSRMYNVPGASGLVVTEVRAREFADCAQWLLGQQHEAEQSRDRPEPDAKMIETAVAREGELLLVESRQLAHEGVIAGKWYANVTATLCKAGAPISITGVSFEGATANGAVPATVTARLRTLVERAAFSLAAP